MDSGLNIVLDKQREVAIALAEHFSKKDDERGFELFAELLDVQQMLHVLIADSRRQAWIEMRNSQQIRRILQR